jgi:hypothetical protein
MGNNDRSKIVGKRDVQLETTIDIKLKLKLVRHVEGLRFNMLSIG